LENVGVDWSIILKYYIREIGCEDVAGFKWPRIGSNEMRNVYKILVG
jgi:hypothetical protein